MTQNMSDDNVLLVGLKYSLFIINISIIFFLVICDIYLREKIEITVAK